MGMLDCRRFDGWSDHSLLAAFIGAVLGCLIAVKLTDWALIVVSSLVGAAVVVGELNFQPPVILAAFVVLTLVGATLQVRQWRRESRASHD